MVVESIPRATQALLDADLSVITTAMRLNWDLERAGDLACNICKTIRRMYGTSIEPKLRGLIVQMSDEAYRLTRLAIDAYAERNVALAAALDDMDDRLDALQRDFIIALIEQH